MTKKRIGTKRRRVKKQAKRKSRKMRKSMRGGSRLFVQKIASCIPQDPVNYSDIPISSSGYMNNDDDWTKLAENISHNGPIEFQCDGKDAVIDGINLDINFDTGTKKGKLYGKIGESRPVLLWWNGRQQTYEPPQGSTRITSQNEAPSTPPRITPIQNSPPRINRRNTNEGVYPPNSPNHDDVGVSLFENDIPYYRGIIGYNNSSNNLHYPLPEPPRTQ